MKELKETAELMTSADYKDRFVAEYWQVKIRYDKLADMLARHKAGTLEFKPTCPINLLSNQKAHMGRYLQILAQRAAMEGIDLEVGA